MAFPPVRCLSTTLVHTLVHIRPTFAHAARGTTTARCCCVEPRRFRLTSSDCTVRSLFWGGSAPLFDPQIGGESENQKIFPAFRRVGQTPVPVSRAITPPLTTAPTYPSPPATLPGSATASPPWWKQTGSNIRGRRGSFKVQKLCRRGADRGGRSRQHGQSALRASTRRPPGAFSLPPPYQTQPPHVAEMDLEIFVASSDI